MRLRSALLSLACLAAPLAAQRDFSKLPFAAGYLTTGGNLIQNDAINARMNSAGFAALSDDGIGYGIAGYSNWFGPALVGFEFAGVDFGPEGRGTRTNRSGAKSYLFQAGYALIAKPTWTMYGMLGVGRGTMSLTVSDVGVADSTRSPTFDAVLARPGEESVLKGSYLMFEPMGGLDWMVKRFKDESYGIVFSMRGGLRMAPNRTDWTLNGRNVRSGPDGSPAGPYLRVGFGFGSR